ncbi:hypothetical protein PVAP13_4NG229533 [Panicum virgatum]|uniref:BED-type domain-containing protein n=1 Tax=Panicum virgatum TaxID=38727 RepID=A0A8T0T7J9_PANVG|nr:hypothetical protein PVAP13_4NG229533 [Panicum virgatum]
MKLGLGPWIGFTRTLGSSGPTHTRDSLSTPPQRGRELCRRRRLARRAACRLPAVTPPLPTRSAGWAAPSVQDPPSPLRGGSVVLVSSDLLRRRRSSPSRIQIMDVPYVQGEAQSDSGRKWKRTPQPTSTPLVEGVELNTNASEVEQIQTSNALQPNGDSEHVGDGENHDSGDGWEDEDYGNGWEDEEMDEENRPGCVEGRIEPGMVSRFLHGEENRQFRSKVWNEFSKIRVAGIVTKGQCNHCSAEITAKRGAGTSAMITHLKRCKVRKSVTNMACQLRSAVMSPEGVSLDNWKFSQEVSRNELSQMISLHGLPLSIVDYEGFRRFIKILHGRN